MAFFTVYLDDTGTATVDSLAGATALIIPAARIIAMENELRNLKKREGFSDFHTSKFVARNYESEFAKWDDFKQKRVFRRVIEITQKFGVQSLFVFCKKTGL